MNHPPVVLVVEDDEDDCFFLEQVVSQADLPCELLFASNGAQALECLEVLAKLPDFIITDVNMPRLNGLELLKAIKSEQKWATIPVILLSTATSAFLVEEAYSLGAANFIVKPVDLDELENVWKRIYQFWLLLA